MKTKSANTTPSPPTSKKFPKTANNTSALANNHSTTSDDEPEAAHCSIPLPTIPEWKCD